jgi:hypothetical protein
MHGNADKFREKKKNHVQRTTGNAVPTQMMDYQVQGVRSNGRLRENLKNHHRLWGTVLGVENGL